MAAAYAPVDLRAVAAGLGGFRIQNDTGLDNAGQAVAGAGDINADGFDDLVVGVPNADAVGKLRADVGAAYVVFGKAGGFGAAIDMAAVAAGIGGFFVQGDDFRDYAGSSVASAGDVNGDGFDDLLVGVPGDDGPRDEGGDLGACYVVLGHAGPFANAAFLPRLAAGRDGLAIIGERNTDQVGYSTVASAGDIDADGLDDLILGVPFFDGPDRTLEEAGSAYVVFGRSIRAGTPIDLLNIAAGVGGFVIRGGAAHDVFGLAAAAAGDVNGDGFGDLVIGAPGVDGKGGAESPAGATYVVFGKAGPFSAGIDLASLADGVGGFVILGDAGDFSGESVASAGDINGDGLDDLIIGAALADGPDNPRFGAGASYVVFGRIDGFGASIDLEAVAKGRGGFVVYGAEVGDSAGTTVASAGDVNGDGFDDLLIGASSWNGPSYVLFGHGGRFDAAIDLRTVAAGVGGFAIQAENASEEAGTALASAGDVNGDGFDDIIVGAPHAGGPRSGKGDTGAAYVVFGGAFQPGPAAGADPDLLRGGHDAEGLLGLDGGDRLKGRRSNDSLSGGAGDDRLRGGPDTDVLSGGEGADRFQFGSRSLGAPDRILDFDAAEGDRIVLRGIDAIAGTAEDDAFTIIGTAAFSHTAGELRWQDRGRGVQRIEGDVDGDGFADLVIDIANDATPVEAGWFVL